MCSDAAEQGTALIRSWHIAAVAFCIESTSRRPSIIRDSESQTSAGSGFLRGRLVASGATAQLRIERGGRSIHGCTRCEDSRLQAAAKVILQQLHVSVPRKVGVHQAEHEVRRVAERGTRVPKRLEVSRHLLDSAIDHRARSRFSVITGCNNEATQQGSALITDDLRSEIHRSTG